MKLKILITSLLVLSFSVSTVAHGPEELNEVKEEFNQMPVPDFLGTVVGDQLISFELHSEQQVEQIGVKMDGTEIEEIRQESYENSTLEAEVSADHIEQIAAAEEPLEALSEMLQNDEINYNAEGTANKVRVYVAETLIDIGAFFS